MFINLKCKLFPSLHDNYCFQQDEKFHRKTSGEYRMGRGLQLTIFRTLKSNSQQIFQIYF